MPENAYRKGHLWSQAAQGSSYSQAALKRQHPDWLLCHCGWPINPAALVGGFTTHPNCDRSAA